MVSRRTNQELKRHGQQGHGHCERTGGTGYFQTFHSETTGFIAANGVKLSSNNVNGVYSLTKMSKDAWQETQGKTTI